MLWWLKFWKINSYLVAYLRLISKPEPKLSLNIYLILGLLITEFAHLFYLCFFFLKLKNFTNIDRLLNFDLTFLWDCHPKVNFLHISINLQIIFFFYCSFYRVPSNQRLVSAIGTTYKVLFFNDNRPFRVKGTFKKVKRVTWMYIRMVIKPVVVVVFAIILFNHARLLQLVILNFDNLKYFFTTFKDVIFAIAQFLFFKTCFDFRICTGTLVNVVISVIIVAFTATTFMQLNQANGLLRHSEKHIKRALKLKTMPAIYTQFAAYHTAICTNVERFKVLISDIVIGYLVVEFPVNTFILIEVVFGSSSFGFVSFTIISLILGTQYVVIFGFHLLSALYSSKMHSCKSALWKVNSQVCCTKECNDFRFMFKMSSYIEKVSTENRYGIFYGNINLITVFSFGKVFLIKF